MCFSVSYVKTNCCHTVLNAKDLFIILRIIKMNYTFL